MDVYLSGNYPAWKRNYPTVEAGGYLGISDRVARSAARPYVNLLKRISYEDGHAVELMQVKVHSCGAEPRAGSTRGGQPLRRW
jgi:hypothetical protein